MTSYLLRAWLLPLFLSTQPLMIFATPANDNPTLIVQELPSDSSRTDTSPQAHPPLNDHGLTFPLEELVDNPDKHNDRFYTEFFNMLATLGLVIAILLIAAWLIRRLLNTRLEQINTTSTIKILERRALSPRSSIYLLEIYDKVVAIAETQSGITQLGEFPSVKTEEQPEETQVPPSSFRKILDRH